MRVGTALLLGALVLAAACGDSAPPRGPDLEVVSLAGETEQGLRMRIDVVGDREVSLRIPVDCRLQGEEGASAEEGAVRSPSVEGRPLRAEVAADGSFVVDEDYVEEGVDGDEEHVDVRVEGDLRSGETASGTVDVRARWWNGQADEFTPDCESGTVRWTTDEPVRQGDDLVVPSVRTSTLQPLGSDLLAVIEDGEALRVDHRTGDVRWLDGSGPGDPGDPGDAGHTGTESAGGGEVAPEVEVAGPGATVLWRGGVAAVAEGVWMPDPERGVVARTELTDGRRSATIDAAVDDMTAGHGALWTVSTEPGNAAHVLEKRDPVTGAVLATVPVVERGTLVSGPTALWHAYGTLAGSRLARIDPETLATVDTFAIDVDVPADDIAATEDRVWFVTWEGLTSIDAATGQQTVVDLPSQVSGMAADRTGVWVTHPRESVARRIEGDAVVRTVDLPDGWWDVAVVVGGANDNAIIRLDPTTTAG